MKKQNLVSIVVLVCGFGSLSSFAFADVAQRAVKIIKPAHKATVSNPVEFCIEAYGLEVEPAKKGVNEGKGHHHLLVDVNIPVSFGMAKALTKDSRYIHMGDGSSCKTLTLRTGRHFIRTLFARGNHVPYDPPISDTIVINVE
jgi:hypothetical protein